MTRHLQSSRGTGRSPHDAIADAALALARPVVLDRVLAEIGQQVQRVLRCETVAIAIVEGAVGSPPRLTHAIGSDDNRALAARLRDQWTEVVASGTVVTSQAGATVELTAPMRSERGIVGVISAIAPEVEDQGQPDSLAQVLASIGRHAAAAIERAHTVRRLEHRRRVTTVDEMSVGLAHELRNRLFGISSAAQLLRFRVTEDPAVEKNVGRILREVERMNNTVNALLEFGQPAELQLSIVDPDAVWDEVVVQQRGRLESKALQLVRERPSAPVTCSIDRAQIATVLVNLLVNAVDAAPDGSDLVLSSAVLPDGSWQTRLANGGAPVSAEVIARAFNLFFTTKQGGTGMGLPLCQRIVADHGGHVALEAHDNGTVASITLPGSAS